jgi:RNA polymerase sigma-70 factor (ECF subfamily)
MTTDDPGLPPSSEDWGDLPDLLRAAETDAAARDRVVTMLYPELKRIAEIQMRRERRDHTLQATGLVSEFFLHIAKGQAITARTRAHFLLIASSVMRRLLVDYARARKRDKRGGQMIRVDFDHADPAEDAQFADLLEIDDLLSQLAKSDPRMARVVELRFFGGLSIAEAAEALGIHERTVKRDWQVARAWLYSQLRRENPHGGRGLGSD